MRETLTTIARHGEAALYGGPLGDILVDYMKAHGGFITREDLASYKTVERAPIRGRLSRLGDPRAAAAGGLRRAHRADAEYSRRLRHRRHGVRHGRDHPSAGRGAEDRLCRSRRRQRRSGFRRGAGRAADLEGLCRRAPRARSIPAERAKMGRRRAAARRRAHHAHDSRRCDGNVVATHADHQQSVRRAVFSMPGLGTVPEQLHEPLRSRGPATLCRWRRASGSPPRCRR